MKTGQAIITDIIGFLSGSPLAQEVNGAIYRRGTRPRDSKAEDILVIYTTADASQYQRGVVTLNVYVPYVSIGRDGVLVPDSERCETIEAKALETFQQMTASMSDYRFELRDAIHTDEDDEIDQSFVVVRLGFWFID